MIHEIKNYQFLKNIDEKEEKIKTVRRREEGRIDR